MNIYIFFITICILSMLLIFSLFKKGYISLLSNKIYTFNKLLLLVIEWVLFSVIVVLFLYQGVIFFYKNEVHILLLLFDSILLAFFIIYVGILIKKYRDDLPMLLVVILIILGLLFLFLVLPDYVPDEQAHFQKAYLVSNFKFGSSLDVVINSDYGIKKFSSYNDIFTYIGFDLSPEYKLYHEACSYSFILYILPSIFINIGKMLHLTLYSTYYIGRMANLIIYIFLAYYSVKITPKCKPIFFVIFLNPMFIHLGASYSADVLISSICIFSVSYFIYLYHKSEGINNIDIIIVIACIFLIAIGKYVYLPLYGIYFIIIPKLIKIKKSQWALLFSSCILGFFVLGITLFLNQNSETIESQAIYLREANVDAARQIEFLMSDYSNIKKMYISTFFEKIGYYFETYISRLGWLEIYINKFAFAMYYMLIFISASMEDVRLKITNRIWFFFLGIVISALVVLGLYLYWTPVGWLVAQGIQGRYFIPVSILFLVALSNNCFKKIKYKNLVLCSIGLVINLSVAFDILVYFI